MSFAGITSKKVDNHAAALPAKIEIRQRVLEALGDVSVFDAFAGTGQLHAAVWHKARAYVGCDVRYSARGCSACGSFVALHGINSSRPSNLRKVPFCITRPRRL